MVTFDTIFRRGLGLIIGLIFLWMISVMLGRPDLYPTWTLIMMGGVMVLSFWYGFRDLVPY